MKKFPNVNFVGSTLWEQKNRNVQVFFVGLFFFCGHLRNCSRLSKHCTKSASEDMCPKGGPNNSNSEDEMCPRWASFSNFKLGG